MATRILGVLLLTGLACSLPIFQDSLEVGSSLSEIRVEAPAGFDLETAATHGGDHQGHGGSHHGDVGYLRTKASKGNNGYQHFDSFHKKDGDKYGFEKHSAFGKKNEGGDGGSHHEGGSYAEDDGGHGGSYGGSYSSSDDGGEGEHHGAASSDIGKYAKADDNENAGTGEYGSYDDGGSSEHYSGGSGEHYGGGGGGGGGGEGGGSYHDGGSHHGGGGGGGDGDVTHRTEYSEGDKDNGSYGSSYKSGSSYGDE